ncbi:unnamed protein product [Cuscuta europaea]|uniref:Uncharacterized protein n=1 Tax=Cuscuta europaea TaxID=41803 RepID=A0A9P1E5V6_CUSEU|nr:unnamed protein product [Cuscuta europaea]
MEEQSSSEPPAKTTSTAPSGFPLGNVPRETLQLSLVKGSAVTHGTVEPKAFLLGMTSELDRAALGKYDDATLENKILWSSLTACIALGEQAHRLEEWRLQKVPQEESMKKLIRDKDAALREMCRLEEAL